MIQETDRYRIPYTEYRAIGRLLQAHVDVHGRRLRALVAFGDLATTGPPLIRCGRWRAKASGR